MNAAMMGGGYYGMPNVGFYGGGGRLFGAEIVALLAIFAWVSICCIVLFGTLKVTGLFRVTEEEEIVGMDISHHGGSAYEWQVKDGEKDDEKPPPPAPEETEGEARSEETKGGDAEENV